MSVAEYWGLLARVIVNSEVRYESSLDLMMGGGSLVLGGILFEGVVKGYEVVIEVKKCGISSGNRFSV